MFVGNLINEKQDYFTYPGRVDGFKKWKPIVTAIIGVIIFFIFSGVVPAIIGFVGALNGHDFTDIIASFKGGYDTMDNYTFLGVFLNMGIIAAMIPALFLAMKITKERPFHTLISSRDGWNSSFFKKGLIIALIVNGIPQVVFAAMEGGFSHINIRYTIPGFILFVILVPFQCIAEEFVFRGYIGQTVSTWLKNPIIGIVVSTILFTIVHPYNTVGKIFVFFTGLTLAFAVKYTKGLEVSCALHTVNNFFSFLLSGIGANPISSQVKTSDLIQELIINIVFFALVIIMDKKKNWFAGSDGSVATEESSAS
ncbi:CPBP family intramembrane glutamic endopeptidase [Butyrivibrio sp. VCD2006]|uniref:CPBP family intramembrane glutamic endopeptidase n=1 Tax=Butyrivibrio sp. VCD2006 TaxID=1280664 RepID=UPI0003FEE12A|nr:CPBP family intramembrane glutamic endopeptidase [Butyrivibrio sp. VCD2006]